MHNFGNEDHGKQDQSNKTTMEDSNTMTVEFLRARLLSERSVSRTAKERADELAKRVIELEEQLKIVTLQRKKAEKAAAEVLAILVNNGISDLSEVNDSSSEQEGVLCESEEGNNSIQEGKNSATMKPRRSEEKELSGWELEASPLIQRSLSWKSCTGSPDSLEKDINQARKRNRNLANSGTYTKKQLGKSCRQIKQKETRSDLAEIRDEPFLLDSQDNGTSTGRRDVSNEKDNPEILNEDSMNERVYSGYSVHGSLESRTKESSANGSDVDMERALEDQAQLIDRYEAEENAQREWEEKFKENNTCSPDSCEPGNHSDITDATEEREMRTETLESAHTMLSQGARSKSEPEDVCDSGEVIAKRFSKGFLPTTTVDMGCSKDQQSNYSEIDASPNDFPEFSFPCQENPATKANWKQEQDFSENNLSRPTSCESSEHQLAQKFSTVQVGGSFYEGGSTRSRNELQVSVHNEALNGLGNVLESLQWAKLSLKHELSKSPSGSQRGSIVRAGESPILDIKPRDVTEFPAGCGGLFRVPTGPQCEIPPKTNFSGHSSDSGSSLTRYYPDLGVGVGVAAGDRYTTSRNLDTRSRSSNFRPYNDPYLDTGMALPPSNRHSYQSYADLMPRMPRSDEVSRPYSNTGPRMPVEDHYSGYSDQFRSNMHRHRTL